MAVMIIQLFQFIFLFAMSAVIRADIKLIDARNENTNIEIIKRAIAITKNLDEDEFKLLDLIFNINIKKLFLNNPIDTNQLNQIQWHFMQCKLLLTIARKIKLMTMSIEDFLAHDAFVEANFHYDEPQQRVYNEIQNCLNTMTARDALDQVMVK